MILSFIRKEIGFIKSIPFFPLLRPDMGHSKTQLKGYCYDYGDFDSNKHPHHLDFMTTWRKITEGILAYFATWERRHCKRIANKVANFPFVFLIETELPIVQGCLCYSYSIYKKIKKNKNFVTKRQTKCPFTCFQGCLCTEADLGIAMWGRSHPRASSKIIMRISILRIHINPTSAPKNCLFWPAPLKQQKSGVHHCLCNTPSRAKKKGRKQNSRVTK